MFIGLSGNVNGNENHGNTSCLMIVYNCIGVCTGDLLNEILIRVCAGCGH